LLDVVRLDAWCLWFPALGVHIPYGTCHRGLLVRLNI
jgi:hypothetical protein